MSTVKTMQLLLVVWCLVSNSAGAAARIAVLDFELNDITSLPNTPAERARTASMAPLLRDMLNRDGGFQAELVDGDTQQAANAGFGYLFRNHDLAARLGRGQGVDWVLVGQHSKPSFLFSYLWVYLVNVKTQAAVARYDIELKGNHQKVTEHAIRHLVGKVIATIANKR